MTKAQAFLRLMDLDYSMQESSKRLEQKLAKLEEHYQLRKQEIIQEYTRKMEEETAEAFQQIIKQGEEEVEIIKNRTKRQLGEMEKNFTRYRDQIADEILARIFDIKREK